MESDATSGIPPRDAAGATSVVIGDDRPVVRAGLRAVLADAAGITVVGDGPLAEIAATVEVREPDLLVVAVRENDPGTFHALATTKKGRPALRVLIVADGSTMIDLREAVIAGVDSFLLTTATTSDIRDAVVRTAAGERVVSPEVAMQLAGARRPAGSDRSEAILTPRELEVLQLVAEGLTNQEVGERLGLSARTVKTHVQNLLVKLDAPDRTGAVARGFRLHLIR